MSAPDQNDAAEAHDGLWSGAAATPGSEVTPAIVLLLVVLAVPAVLLGAILFAVIPVLPWWLGAIVGLLVAIGAVVAVHQRADRLVLSTLGPGIPESEHPIRLTNMVEGLTLAGGVIAPDLLVLDDPARNAMAVRRHDRNHLVVTSGLVQNLEVVELEAAVAELLTRLRNGDAERSTLGAAMLGRPLIDGPLGSLLGPVADRVLAGVLPVDRDLEADRQAVTLTRYPPGLIKALESMQGHELRPRVASAGTDHLWLADPSGDERQAEDPQRAPLSLRIDALAEL